MIKAISIDPFTCTVSEVEYDGSDFTQIYPLMSHPAHPVDTFTTARVDTLREGDALFVDDEGLFKSPPRWFQIAGGHQPFAGKGLIIGSDSDGESRSCKTSVDLVRMSVIFLERFGNGHGLIQAREPYEETK
jgi:hypothetical protein